MQVSYQDILRVWREADTIREIEHAWLFDHLMPIGGDPDGPIFEGWTLLSALAAQTQRPRWRAASTRHMACPTTTSGTPWRTSPKPARSSGGCGQRPSRSTFTAPTSISPARSATRSLSSSRTRRS
jgi:hypothetical protein